MSLSGVVYRWLGRVSRAAMQALTDPEMAMRADSAPTIVPFDATWLETLTSSSSTCLRRTPPDFLRRPEPRSTPSVINIERSWSTSARLPPSPTPKPLSWPAAPKGRTYNADGDAQRPEQDPMSPPAAAAADPGHCDQPRGIKSIKDIMRYQPSIWSWFTNHGRRAGSSTRRSGVQASYYRDWLFSSAANWRMSPTKKSGSSQAAKCPAFSMS